MKKKKISMNQFFQKKYITVPIEGIWKDSFGEIEAGSRWMIYGESGNGKTDFCVKLAKMLSQYKKVAYLSREEGDRSTLQGAFMRNEMQHTGVHLLVEYTFDDIIQELQRKASAEVLIMDSIDYLSITKAQYKQLHELFPKKMLIFVTWGQGNKPMSNIGKAIEFMVDVKVHVQKFVAFPKSRYGGNVPYIIYEKEAIKHHHFLQ